MIAFPNIKEEIFTLGPLKIRWYSMMYILGYVIAGYIWKYRKKQGLFPVAKKSLDSLLSYLIIGMLLGARVFYVFVYNWNYYSQNFNEILNVWQGGLSFHGAIIGMGLAALLYSRVHKLPFYMVTDTLCMSVGPGLFLGRIGNFINSELYGRATDHSWAMVFPKDPLQVARHPSQLYQAFAEGLLLFVVLILIQRCLLRAKKYKHGMMSGFFLMGYGVARFLVEFTREADAQLGYFFGGQFSMGQILCFLMILWGFFTLIYALKKESVYELEFVKN